MLTETLYARKEPPIDTSTLRQGLQSKKDVLFYRDIACTIRYWHWAWHTFQPRKTKKTITLNNQQWRIHWLADLVPDHGSHQMS
jgi:hypothetical protein